MLWIEIDMRKLVVGFRNCKRS